MDDVKKTYREGEQETKEAWRKADGDESVADTGRQRRRRDAQAGRQRRRRPRATPADRRRRHRARKPGARPTATRAWPTRSATPATTCAAPWTTRASRPPLPTRRSPRSTGASSRLGVSSRAMPHSPPPERDGGPVGQRPRLGRYRYPRGRHRPHRRHGPGRRRPGRPADPHPRSLGERRQPPAVPRRTAGSRGLRPHPGAVRRGRGRPASARPARRGVDGARWTTMRSPRRRSPTPRSASTRASVPVAVVTEFRILRQEIGRAMATQLDGRDADRATPWPASPSSAMRSTVPRRSA